MLHSFELKKHWALLQLKSHILNDYTLYMTLNSTSFQSITHADVLFSAAEISISPSPLLFNIENPLKHHSAVSRCSLKLSSPPWAHLDGFICELNGNVHMLKASSSVRNTDMWTIENRRGAKYFIEEALSDTNG